MRRLSLHLVLVAVLASSCSSDKTNGGAGGAGANATGGAPNAGSGGLGASTGGNSTGGTATAGGSAGATTGGTANGGAGGTSTGGTSTGGTSTGGTSTGGTSTGGTSTGGCSVGTTPPTTLPKLGVDLANRYRSVTHAASGSLYGLASDGTPPDSLIGPTKPFMFTQMAPNGEQLPNGATSPTGDALKVAPAAARAGAKITIRMPDTYPNFPYRWVSWSDWNARVDAMVTAVQNSGATNIYAYEIWNEPNWTWDTANAGSFNAGWRDTYRRIRAKDSSAKILGPSISIWDQNFMRSFLTYCQQNDCLPDIVCWHELGDVNGVARPRYIPTSVAAYRALEANLGISKRPISINEYGVPTEEGVPGAMIRYVAQFERQGVESANIAFWHQAGQLSDLITRGGQANGGWWLYKFYGDMSGSMAMTTPPVTGTTALDLDGIASIDVSSRTVSVVFGGATGNNAIVIQGFDSAAGFACNAHVKAETTPWNGVNTAVAAPTALFESDYPIENGQITVVINGMSTNAGYRLTVTPN